MSTTMTTDTVYLTRRELAKRWRVGIQCLANWAHEGKGPVVTKIGRHVRYGMPDVLAYEASRMVHPRLLHDRRRRAGRPHDQGTDAVHQERRTPPHGR